MYREREIERYRDIHIIIMMMMIIIAPDGESAARFVRSRRAGTTRAPQLRALRGKYSRCIRESLTKHMFD